MFASIAPVKLKLMLAFTVLFLAACVPSATPTPTPAPPAGVILQQILTDCWGVTQLKELDATRPDHVRAFECARPRLLTMARNYPSAAEPHRLLAWGYLYALDDEAAAQAEYERTVEIYNQLNRTQDESEILIRLAMLALQYDRLRGCTLLRQAADTDTRNESAPVLLQNFGCNSTSFPLSTVEPTIEAP